MCGLADNSRQADRIAYYQVGSKLLEVRSLRTFPEDDKPPSGLDRFCHGKGPYQYVVPLLPVEPPYRQDVGMIGFSLICGIMSLGQ